MKNIKLLIEYDGSRYNGWQRLKNNSNTIQGKIENIISMMVGEPVNLIASGRTDSGVHARGQVANFHCTTLLSNREISNYINGYLPEDIVVKDIEEVDGRFHSRYNCVQKKYSYYIYNGKLPCVFNRKYCLHLPEELDLIKISKAMELFMGTHDFIGFSSLKKTKKSTVRTIYCLEMNTSGKLISFDFIGDGFLYNMIRIIMGSILEIGMDKKQLIDIEHVFITGNREEAGYTVPPHGLFLEQVYYD